MAIEETPKDPARIRLEAIIEYRKKRKARALEKLTAAEREFAEATAELLDAMDDLDKWIEDHPDPHPR